MPAPCKIPFDELRQKIIELYKQNYTIAEIQKILHCRTGTIIDVLRKEKLTKKRGWRSWYLRTSTIKIPDDERKISQCAAFLDGEGFIYIRGHKVTVGIANTRTELMDWLKENFGGAYIQAITQGNRRKTCYSWRIGRLVDVEKFLKAVLPYLILKKEKAEQALKVIEQRKYKNKPLIPRES